MPHRSPVTPARFLGRAVCFLALSSNIALADDQAPKSAERQLPYAMHSAMSERPTVRVGRRDADLVGADHRVLQAAVDYVAKLGGGTVEIGEGEYLMGDSLHLRSNVTVRGHEGEDDPPQGRRGGLAAGHRRRLRRAADHRRAIPRASRSARESTIWDDHSGGFHTTVARITGRDGNRFSIDADLMSDYMVSAHAKAATVYPVVGGTDIRSARVEDLVIEGNKQANPHLNGCRGAGIYLYRGFGVAIRGCVVRNYHGDGISFQQSNDVTVAELRRRGQHRPRAAPRQRLAAADRPRLPGPPQRDRRAVPLLARPPRGVRGQPPRGQRPGRHLDRPQGLGQPAARQPRRPQRHLRRALPRRGGRDVAAPQSPGAERHRGQRPLARHARHPRPRRARRLWSSKATRSATPATGRARRRPSAS